VTTLRLLTLGLPILAACEPGRVQFYPDLWASWNDTGLPVPSGNLGIDHDHVDWGCRAASDAYVLQIYTVGPSGGGRLTLFGPSGEREVHPLRFEDTSPDGAWDRWAVGPLADGAPEAVPGSATRFDCGAADQPAAIVQIADRFGLLADCVAMGPEWPDALKAVAESAGPFGCHWIHP